MAVTGIFHHVGTFFLLVATALLLVTTITAPVVNDISMLEVKLSNTTSDGNSRITFGTFGYCVTNSGKTNDDDDFCTKKVIGYNPLAEVSRVDRHDYDSSAAENTSKGLTRVMVLHPVACGLSFIAFLLAVGSGFIGALFAAVMSSLAFIVTLVVLATDFTAFGIVKNKVNDRRTAAVSARFGTGIWTLLAALVLLFLATVIVLLTCCSARMHSRREKAHAHGDKGYKTHTTTTRRRFWQRRSRY